VGVYNVARRLVESLTFIPENIVIAFFPAISILYLQNRRKFDQTFQQALQSMLIIAIPFSLGLFLLARPIIQFMFEPEYLAAYRPLQWFGLWLGVLFMKHIFATTLNAIGKQGLFSRLAGLSMVLNAGLNYLLIPMYQIEGASLATLISEAITAFIAFVAVRKYLSLPHWSSFYLRLTGVLILLGSAGFFFRNSNLFLAVGLIGLIYLILLFLFHIVTPSEVVGWIDKLKPQPSKPKN
jgi:O-antigen/teichoic acid export membrane protein